MAGTKEGGLKAAQTNKAKYGEDFYKKIGADGGSISSGGGFAADPQMASLAGRLGGLKSRRDSVRFKPDSDAIKSAQKEIKIHKSYRKYNGSNS